MSNDFLNMDRRSFLRNTALLGATALTSSLVSLPFAQAADFKPPLPLKTEIAMAEKMA